MRAAFIPGHPRPKLSRRDRVGNSGLARVSRRGAGRRRLLPELRFLLEPGWQL